MNVLSTFDGMSCGQIALERARIAVDNYYASEIDKYAIQVTQGNYPSTIQLGDVKQVRGVNLPEIDLLIGGSPCQGFSFAGLQLNFEDPRSKLFFEYVRILEEVKPKYFLMENVKMKKEYQDVISDRLGAEPMEINSALVSAQNRRRLYWTNIPGITQLEDKRIMLKDILEDGSNQIGASRGRYTVDGKRQDGKMKVAGLTEQRMELRKDNKSNTLTTVAKDNYVIVDPKYYLSDAKIDRVLNSKRGKGFFYTEQDNKIGTIIAGYHKEPTDGAYIHHNGVYRKLTPVECERLQTVPDNYTASVSNTQRYKMLGNGWTVDVIAHILSFIK